MVARRAGRAGFFVGNYLFFLLLLGEREGKPSEQGQHGVGLAVHLSAVGESV